MVRRTHALNAALLGLAVLWSAIGAGTLAAQPSWFSQMNYQGQLTDNLGEPVADGTYTVIFRIWDNSSGGSLQWSESQSVTVTRGLFNVVLGSNTGLDSLSDGVKQGDLWLGLEVNGNGEMSPRQQFLPSMYSYNSRLLDGNPLGTGAYNVVQLNASGKIPAGLVAGGSFNPPLDLTGNGGTYNLQVNNTNASSFASSILATSTNGTAVQASSSGAAQSAVGGIGTYIGVSGSGGTYGILGQSNSGSGVRGAANTGVGVYGLSTSNYGVYGTSSVNGVYGNSSGSNAGVVGAGYYGVQGNGTFFGVYANGGTYGLYATGSSFGTYATTAGATGKGTWSRHTGTGQGFGVYGETTSNSTDSAAVYGGASGATGQVYGVKGEVSSTSYLSAGVMGRSTGANGRGVIAQATGSNAIALDANSAAGTAVNAFGYGAGVNAYASSPSGTGVYGEGLYGISGGVFQANGAAVYGYSESNLSPAIYGYNVEGGTAIKAYADTYGVSSTAYTFGVFSEANGPGGAAGRFIAWDTSAGQSAGVWGEAKGSAGMGGRFTNYAGGDALVAEGNAIGLSASSGTTYAIWGETAGVGATAGRFASNAASGTGVGVQGIASSGTGIGGRFTANGSSSARAVVAEGTGVAVSATSSGTFAIWADSYNSYAIKTVSRNSDGAFFQAASTGSNWWAVVAQSDSSSSGKGVYGIANGTSSQGVYGATAGNSSQGVWGTTSGSSNSMGVKGDASCLTCFGGYFSNTSTTASPTSGGASLYVSGRADFPDMTGTVLVSAGATLSTFVSVPYMSSNDRVLLTPRNYTGTTVYWVTTSVGGFNINFSPALPNSTVFNYFVAGD